MSDEMLWNGNLLDVPLAIPPPPRPLPAPRPTRALLVSDLSTTEATGVNHTVALLESSRNDERFVPRQVMLP